MPLDPALKPLLEAMAQSDAPAIEDMSPSDARAYFEETSQALPKGEPIELASVQDRSFPGPGGAVPVRIYRPHTQGAAALPVLVYFHGGGWVIGGLDTHDATCRELAQGAACLVVAVDYRLAPEHPYPAAAEDCFAALTWVAQHAAELGADPARIAVGGDSAGGNLAAVVALLARDQGGPRLAFQLLIYPVTDADFERPSYVENAEGYYLTAAAMRWFWSNYVPDLARRSEARCAPLRARDLKGLPPALLQTAGFDPLRDEGEAYARRLQDASVPTTLTRYEGMIHGFFSMGALLEDGRRAVTEATDALRRAFGGDG